MSTPPMNEGPPDELIEAYRRASLEDSSRPSPHIRDAILAQARSGVESERGGPIHVQEDHAAPAANDAQWAWRAVAGIAVVGLVGLLVAQSFRSVPRGVAPVTAVTVPHTPLAGARPPGVGTEPTHVAVPGEGAAQVNATRAIAPPSRMFSAKSVDDGDAPGPVAKSERGGASEQVTAGAAEPVTDALAGSAGAPASVAAAPPADQDTQYFGNLNAVAGPRNVNRSVALPGFALSVVRRAVKARFPNLFTPKGSAEVNLVTVIMNKHGDIDRARVESIPGGALDGAALAVPDRFVALGLKRDQVGPIGFDRLVEPRSAEHPTDTVLFVLYAWPRQSGEPVP